jgi:hypothetical protein
VWIRIDPETPAGGPAATWESSETFTDGCTTASPKGVRGEPWLAFLGAGAQCSPEAPGKPSGTDVGGARPPNEQDHPRRGLCFSLLGRRSQRHTEFRCLLICSSHAPLQSASDYRGLCLLSCEGFEYTDVLFCPIPPFHRLLCHPFAPCKPAAQSAPHVEQKFLMIGSRTTLASANDLAGLAPTQPSDSIVVFDATG